MLTHMEHGNEIERLWSSGVPQTSASSRRCPPFTILATASRIVIKDRLRTRDLRVDPPSSGSLDRLVHATIGSLHLRHCSRRFAACVRRINSAFSNISGVALQLSFLMSRGKLRSLRAGSKAHHLLLAAWLSAMNLGRSDLVALAVTPPIRLPTLCFARQLIGRLVRLRQNVIRLILRGLEREHRRLDHRCSINRWLLRTIRRIILSCGKSWRKKRAEAQSRDIDSVSWNFHFNSPLVSRHSQDGCWFTHKEYGPIF